MKLIGMGKAAVAEPKLLVETFRVDDERFAFPFADGTSVVKGIIRIASNLAFLLPSIGVDDSIVAITAADKHEDPFAIPVFIELQPIRQLVLTRTARRHTVQVHRIVFEKISLA